MYCTFFEDCSDYGPFREVELTTLDDLMKLVDTYGALIIGGPEDEVDYDNRTVYTLEVQHKCLGIRR